MTWDTFENSKTIGTRGSENGVIIDDIEHLEGARITIERDGDIAPFAVTIGIYGLMFHTHFCGNEQEARGYVDSKKLQIAEVLMHYQTAELERNNTWAEKLNQLTDRIANE